MKRGALIIGVVLSLVASACAPRTTPILNPSDMQHTAEAAAFTMIAQTKEAVPMTTPLPSTETPSPTHPPTLTSITSPTSEGLPTTAQTVAVQASASTQDNCNKPLTSWEGPTAKLNIANETKPQGNIVLSLWVVTELGECGFLADLSAGPVGMYSASAFVDGQKDFRVFGGFRITQGSWNIVVRNE